MSAPVGIHTPAIIPVDLSRKQIITGRVLTTLAALFLLFDGIAKLFQPAAVIDGTKQLGWPVSVILPLGITLLACLFLHLIPRTSFLGAVLLTGYLGGAVATHVRIGQPLFSHVLFPTYIAALIWGGLWLRDRRLRALLPISK